MDPIRLVRVVIGVLYRQDHHFFIAKRPPQVVLPGYWEFPGGKIEAGESQEQALARELAEEIGISVLNARYLTTFNHHFTDRQVELHVWQVEAYAGEACGNEGQETRWVSPPQLADFVFLPSNEHLLTFLQQRFADHDHQPQHH